MSAVAAGAQEAVETDVPCLPFPAGELGAVVAATVEAARAAPAASEIKARVRETCMVVLPGVHVVPMATSPGPLGHGSRWLGLHMAGVQDAVRRMTLPVRGWFG